MTRVGILTFTWGYNPGTLLQAYAIRSLLTEALPGCAVEMINYQPKKSVRRVLMNVFKPHGLKRAARYHRMVTRYDRFRARELGLEGQPITSGVYADAIAALTDRFDAIVVGSDQVWEVNPDDLRVPVPFPNCFWLGPGVSRYKIAMAVSAAATEAEHLGEPRRRRIAELIQGFDLIGVRDDATERLLRHCAGETRPKIRRTPDPTFGLRFPDRPVAEKLCREGIRLDRPLAGLALQGKPALRSRVVDSLLDRGYQVMTLSPDVAHPDVFVSPASHPLEWASVFSHLDVTVTDRFHAAVFSLKNHVPFVAIDVSPHRVTSSGDSKTACLVREFGLPGCHRLRAGEVERDPDRLRDALEESTGSFDRDSVRESLRRMQGSVHEFLESTRAVLGRCTTGRRVGACRRDEPPVEIRDDGSGRPRAGKS